MMSSARPSGQRRRGWAKRLAFLIGGLLVAGTANEALGQVVVFPLDPRGVSDETAQAATDTVLETLAGIDRLRVIDPETVEQRLNVDLTEQARACQYDVFCLVEIGEILRTSTVLLGHVHRLPSPDQGPLEVKFVVLDVDRAAIAEVLIWTLQEPADLIPAAEAAARRLFGPQDAQVEVTVAPPQATVYLYGDPQAPPLSGPWPTWSGQYRLRVAAEGFIPYERVWRLEPGAAELRVELEPDPLYVPPKSSPSVELFDRSSRRMGSGVTSRDVATVPQLTDPPSRYGRPWPWVTTGLGVAAIVAGVVLMATAQSDYNALADEVRFLPATTPADVAGSERDDAHLRHQVGSGVAIGGAVLTVGGLIWLVAGGEDPPPPNSRLRLSETGARSAPVAPSDLSPAQRRAAAGLAAALTPGGRPLNERP